MCQPHSTSPACLTEPGAVCFLTATNPAMATSTTVANHVFIQHLILSNLNFSTNSWGVDMVLDNGSKNMSTGSSLPSRLKDLQTNIQVVGPYSILSSTRTETLSLSLLPLFPPPFLLSFMPSARHCSWCREHSNNQEKELCAYEA